MMTSPRNTLPMGTKVVTTFDYGDIGKLSGTITGISTVELPVIGCGYVVLLDNPIADYDYTHIVLFEAHFEVQG